MKMGEPFYFEIKQLARMYLDIVQLRDSITKRMNSIEDGNLHSNFAFDTMEHTWNTLTRLRNELLEIANDKLKDHLLFRWCKNVRGMGTVATLTFLGYINPYKADKASQVRAYFGVIPYQKLESGKKIKWNPEAKGRLWLITRNVLMKRDEYYYPIYLKKKEYYLKERGFEKYIENPQLCPRFYECYMRIKAKAERLNREPKKLPCKAHVDNMAKRYLAGILVSNALEVMRLNEGLDVSNFKNHRNYIPPKPFS